MEPTTLKQGEQFTDTGGRTGTVQFDTKTGQKLATGATTQVITPNNLAPLQPVVVPPAPVSTASSDVSASAGALQQKALQAEQDKALAAAQEKEDTSKSDIENLFGKISGVEASRAGIEEEQKIGQKSQAVTDITNKIEASQRAQTNELRALDAQGLTDVQKGQKSREINRRYAFEQADYALIQSAANRDLVTAQSIADRKINLQLEPLKQQLEFAKFFYEENKEKLSKAEQRAFDLKIKDADRKYNEQKTVLELLSNTKLQAMQSASQQEAPASVLQAIQAAKTPEEVIRAAGVYGGDILARQVKLAQLEGIRKQNALIGAKSAADKKAEAAALKNAEQAVPVLEGKVVQIDNILNSSALNSVVGPSIFARAAGGLKGLAGRFITGATGGGLVGTAIAPGPGTVIGGVVGGIGLASQGSVDYLTGERQNFIGDVEQLTSTEFLENLINVKARGATFGALTDREGAALRAAASKIETWRVENGDGKTIGYNVSEKAFKEELQKIQTLTQKALLKASGGELLTPEDNALLDELYGQEETVDYNQYYNN